MGVIIGRLYGVKFAQTQIWRILGALGFSVQHRRAQQAQECSTPTFHHRRVLGTGWVVVMETLAKLGEAVVRANIEFV